MYERSKPVFPQIAAFQHIALKVDQATFDAIERRLSAAGLPKRITDHGYCVSLYTTSPDGLRVDTDGNIWVGAGWVGEGYDGWIEQNRLWGVYPDEKIE